MVMGHLEACSLESTFHVEPLVCFTAIKDSLIAPDFLRNEIECLYNLEAEFLALLVFRHGNIFDVTYLA